MILDPWTIGSIENLLFLLKMVAIDFYMICRVTQLQNSRMACDSQEQSITVLFFLEMENVFQEFFQKKSGRLDSGFLKHFHPLSTVLLCPPFQEYFLLIWSLDLQAVTYHHTGQNNLLLKFHWTAVYFTWLQQSATTNWNIFSNSKNIFSYF